MNVTKLIKLIKSTQPVEGEKGKLFTVSFVKVNGEETTMKARLGMQRNLTGKGQGYDAADYKLMTVWSADRQGYRNIPLDRVTALAINGETYTV